jgi:glycosyltransferase involved in cell wall biosynthesis
VAPPRVTVLLATYNGAAFLDEQLVSLAAQNVERLDIIASDDGSIDETVAILGDWKARWTKGVFTVVAGPRQGVTENFRSLLLRPDIEGEYVAFCDQDDVWDRDKLSAGIGAIAGEPGPALYGSRTRLVDAELRPIGTSRLFGHEPEFRNAIVQNITGGNTMVLNRTGFELVAESTRRTSFATHDWWCYLIVSGAGGRVHYDPVPRIAYRQHAHNLVGANRGARAWSKRASMTMRGEFARRNEANIAALDRCSDLLSDDARTIVEGFRHIRTSGPLESLRLLYAKRIHRRPFGAHLGLVMSILLRKV